MIEVAWGQVNDLVETTFLSDLQRFADASFS